MITIVNISGSWLDPGAFPHCDHIALPSLGCSQVIYDLDGEGDDNDNDDDADADDNDDHGDDADHGNDDDCDDDDDDDNKDEDDDDDDDDGGQVQAERLPWGAVAAKNPSAKRLVGKDQWDGGIKIKIKSNQNQKTNRMAVAS